MSPACFYCSAMVSLAADHQRLYNCVRLTHAKSSLLLFKNTFCSCRVTNTYSVHLPQSLVWSISTLSKRLLPKHDHTWWSCHTWVARKSLSFDHFYFLARYFLSYSAESATNGWDHLVRLVFKFWWQSFVLVWDVLFFWKVSSWSPINVTGIFIACKPLSESVFFTARANGSVKLLCNFRPFVVN